MKIAATVEVYDKNGDRMTTIVWSAPRGNRGYLAFRSLPGGSERLKEFDATSPSEVGNLISKLIAT